VSDNVPGDIQYIALPICFWIAIPNHLIPTANPEDSDSPQMKLFRECGRGSETRNEGPGPHLEELAQGLSQRRLPAISWSTRSNKSRSSQTPKSNSILLRQSLREQRSSSALRVSDDSGAVHSECKLVDPSAE
jgi:hypothetical protein